MKRIGILNACTLEEEVEFRVEEFQSFVDFLDMVEHDFELVEYRITEDEFPENPQECDCLSDHWKS